MNDSKLKHITRTELRYDFNGWSLKSVFLGQLYYATAKKQVWHNFSSVYAGSNAFHLNFVDAVEFVEDRRKKGWYWEIKTIPVVVITEFEKALLVAEINSNEPFKEYCNFSIENPDFEKVCRFFEDIVTKNNYFFTAKTEAIFHLRFPLIGRKSISEGGHIPLEWEPTYNFIMPKYAVELAYNMSLKLADYIKIN